MTMTDTFTTPTDLRLRLLENGYPQLTAVSGKVPKGGEWQLHETTRETLLMWEQRYPNALSTGLVCNKVIGIDVDLLDKRAADAADGIIRDLFPPGARMLVRYGLRPKRLFLFRVTEPFSKFVVTLFAPESAGLDIRNGIKKGGPRIEVLGRGSQFVAFGPHEDTGKPYEWPEGSPLDVRYEDLTEIDEAGATGLVKYITEMLDKTLGYKLASGSGAEFDFSDAPSQEERFKQTEYGGAFGINQAILELPMKRHDEGVWCEEVIRELREVVRNAWDRLPDDHPEKRSWDWDRQHRQIDDSVYGDIKRRCGEHRRLIDLLPDNLKALWREIEQRGGSPELYKKRGLGRGEWSVKDTGPAKEIPTGDPPPRQEKASKYPRLEFIRASDLSSIPPREFYLGKQYQRGAVSGTMAPGGRGKSSLVLVEAVAMAIGRKLLNDDPLRRLKVWYHNGEEHWDELLRRLDAVCKYYGVQHSELENWFCMTSAQRFPLRVAEMGSGDRFSPERNLLAHMYEEIRTHDYDVVAADPLITLHGVPESNPVMMRGVMDIFRDIAAGINCSVEIVGHTRKPPIGFDAQLTAYDTRGSGAIVDALRSVRMLAPAIVG
jgi:hypothetical protein